MCTMIFLFVKKCQWVQWHPLAPLCGRPWIKIMDYNKSIVQGSPFYSQAKLSISKAKYKNLQYCEPKFIYFLIFSKIKKTSIRQLIKVFQRLDKIHLYVPFIYFNLIL